MDKISKEKVWRLIQDTGDTLKEKFKEVVDFLDWLKREEG